MSRVMAFQVETDACINQPRIFNFHQTMLDIQSQLAKCEIDALKFLCCDYIPLGRLENVKYAIQLINELTRQCLIETPDKVSFLAELLWHLGRYDLLRKLKCSPEEVQFELIPNPRLSHVSPYRLVIRDVHVKYFLLPAYFIHR
jgi:Death effector domain